VEFHYSGLPADLDLVKYIKKLGGRLSKMHLAVLDNNGNPAPRQDLIEAAKESGSCKWFVLEQNYPDLATAQDRLKRSVEITREILNK